jgi:hypothetical protein
MVPGTRLRSALLQPARLLYLYSGAGQCASSASIDITIAAQVTPVFTAIGPLCVGATAPALPGTSNNGITGTWNPATISTATAGTLLIHLLLMQVSAATATTTVDVTVTGAVTPTFDRLVIFA